ncbi:MAG: GAF domain-containing protein [Anaerolineae bacterium]
MLTPTMSPAVTILAVDDDPLELDMLNMLLGRGKFNFVRADSGEAALRLIAERPEIDLILLDIMLPGNLDGYEVCRRIRANPDRPYLAIVMVTALGQPDQVARGLEAGADDYVSKPFSAREIVARVQAALRVRRIQRELAEAHHRYQELVETSRDLIFALDMTGRLTYLNPACEALTGYTAETLLADEQPFQRFLHPDDQPRVLSWWRDQLHTRLFEGSDMEFRMIRPDGQVRWGTLEWVPMTDRAGNMVGVQGSIRDITHRKEIEAATWRRSQELAALNLIAARLNQSLELQTTLDEALNALLEIAGIEFGAIQVFENQRVKLDAIRGLNDAEARFAFVAAYPPDINGTQDYHVRHERLDDLTGAIAPAMKSMGIQSLLMVPLRQRGELHGMLRLASRAFGKFDPTEVTLISTVAQQISAAILNAKLYEEARHTAEEMALLNEVGRTMTSSLDLDTVLRVIMENTISMLQGEAGSVLLLDDETGELFFAAAVGKNSEGLKGVRLPSGAGIAGRALREGRTLLVDDTQRDRQFYSGVDQLTGLTTTMLVASPLRVHNRPIGVMEVINKRGVLFTPADAHLLDLLAPSAATAIENARLYARETQLSDEVRRHNRELSTLHAIAAALSESLEIKQVMEAALTVMQPQFEFEAGQITVLDQSVRACYPTSPAVRFDAPVTQQSAEQSIAARTVTLLSDTQQAEQAEAWAVANIGAYVAVPLWGHDHIQGMLQLAWQTARDFTREISPLLAAIGQQIGVALERAHLYEVAQHRAQEIERSHKQLVQSEKLAATGRLAMSLAHEINNPLQAIQNCLHLVLEFPLADERKTYYLKMAREEVERLSILVQSMLDFYRPARSEQTTADVRAVIEKVLALSEQKLRNTGVEIQLTFAPQPLIAQVAPDQLGQVCLNLVMNAAEAMDGGGQLRIEVQPNDGWIEARFIDTGPGIPAADLPHIFEPFYTTKAEGTGLGLAISYSIIERHGGSLQVESVPGTGSTFMIRLAKANTEV